MGVIRTCNWCGKQYDESTIFHGAGVMETYKYCSARCEKAAPKDLANHKVDVLDSCHPWRSPRHSNRQ